MNESVRIAALLASLLPTLAGAPAWADWLVTVDGATVETRGPWQVKGKQVVFTAADGSLAALRESECDLEASALLTRARARSERERAAPSRPVRQSRPVALVLTDADVRRARPKPAPRAPDEPAAPARPAGAVTVSDWRPIDELNGIAIRGEVRNDSHDIVGDLTVAVLFLNADGELIERQVAVVSASTLKPGQKAAFRVEPFELFSYGSIEFEVGHFALLTGAPEGAEVDAGRP